MSVTTSRHETGSPAETEEVARQLSKSLEGGALVFLSGPLGAGKTLVAKAIFGALGVNPNTVTSPTYKIVNRYDRPPTSRPLYHVDLYRITDPIGLEGIGLDEIFESGGVILVEWAERLGDGWPDPDLRIDIEDVGDYRRSITVRSPASD